METIVEEGEEIVGNDAFEGSVVAEADLDPEAVEFGAAEEGFAFGSEAFCEVANKVDGADFGKGHLLVLAVLRQKIESFGAGQAAGIEVAAQGGLAAELNNDLLVRRGWGSRLQTETTCGEAGNQLQKAAVVCYVKRSFLSTYCFY